MKKIILYIILYSTLGLRLYAQSYDVSRFASYTTASGLASNQVNAVIQDGFGFLWIGTKKGLHRFDGNNFLHFYANSNRNSLPQDAIIKLKMLPGNLLAATTGTGLFLMNTQTLQSKTILIPADSLRYSYKVNAIRDIEADKAGNIFLLTRSGFYVINARRQLSFRYDYYSSKDEENKTFAFGNAIAHYENYYILSTQSGLLVFNNLTNKILPANQVQEQFVTKIASPAKPFVNLYSDATSLILLRDSINYLSYYNLKQKTEIKIILPFAPTSKFNWRSSMHRISDTLYAITGKENGFYLISYNKSAGRFTFYNEIYFTDYKVTQILSDHENRLWVSTTNGIFKQKNNAALIEKFYVNPGNNPGKRDLHFTMATVSANKIFAGSIMAGLFVLNRVDGRQINQFEFNDIGPSAKNIYSCINLNADTIMAGTNGPLLMMDSRSLQYKMVNLPGWDKAHNWVSALYKSRAGDTYLTNSEEGQFYMRRHTESNFKLYHHNQNPLFKILTPHYISEDREGHIWFSGHGMSRYNAVNNRFEKKMDSFPQIKMARKEAFGLVADHAGNLYFAVSENGLVIYHPSTNKFEHISRSDGLPDNTIVAIYLLKDKLWIGTESGIACYDITTKKITAFGTADDMPAESFSGIRFYFDSVNTHLYAPFLNTIIRFNPYLLQKRIYAPGFFIEHIRINDKKIFYHPGTEIRLNAGEKNLQVTLASINFEDAWQQQFYYRINNSKSDTGWQLGGSTNSFILNNLAPGRHNIEFRLVSKTNSWQSKVVSIKVYIPPPIWKTAWFIITASLLLITGLFFLYKTRINSIRQKANRDKQLAELEILSLHAQMNPHFIFNALNSIKEMIWQNDKQNASRYLSKFAQLIRSTLEQSRQPFITVNQCVQHLEQYMEMERIRFDEFIYSIELDKNMDGDHIHMAPMLVQPLVENAIWHGLKSKDGNRILEIKFYRDKNHIVCEIGDNGPGINHSQDPKKINTAHKSISIINIHSRLQMLNEKYNMQCSLQLIDKGDADATLQGTTAILRLSI